MHKNFLFVCAFCCVLLPGCQRPAEENKSKFPRQANIEKYVQKAKDASRMAEERKAPLPVADIMNTEALNNQIQEMDFAFLTPILLKNKTALEKRLLEVYAQKTSEQLTALMQKHILKAQETVKEMATAKDLSEKLTQVFAEQDNELKDFLSAHQTTDRLMPHQQLLDHSKEQIALQTQPFVEQIRLYYGNESAMQVQPMLEKAVQDYVYAMASASDPETLQEKINSLCHQTQEQLRHTALQYADPLGITQEEQITLLRGEMITKHQALEAYVEPLYGKEAVLQMRKIFNELLEQTGAMLRQSTRLSQKKQSAAQLNEHYRKTMLSLQEKWNEELLALKAAQQPETATH